MAVLVLIGSQFLLFNYFSTGPNLYLSFAWVQLYRHGNDWTVDEFHFGILMGDIIVSVALTWVLSKMLQRRIT